MSALKLIVGLGNPGTKYEETRHNAGFFLLDDIALRYGASFLPEKKFQGEVARTMIGSCDLRLLKPTTFMNLSGESVQALASFYRIEPEEILVAHDELDLPPGIVRLKKGGGHGGHNGLRDITRHLGKEYWRIRLGIGHPGNAKQVASFVLKRAPSSESELLTRAIDEVMEQIPGVAAGEMAKAMNALHKKPEKAKPEKIGPEKIGPEKIGPEKIGPEKIGPEKAEREKAEREKAGSEKGGLEKSSSEKGGAQRN